MIPAAFEYARASSVEEAVKLLNKYGEDAKVLAGGHSLIPLMRLRLAQPKALVDINGIKGLDQIKESGGKLHVGALARHVTIQNSQVVKDKLPLLAYMAGEIGDNQVRNMGTIGGVVAHAVIHQHRNGVHRQQPRQQPLHPGVIEREENRGFKAAFHRARRSQSGGELFVPQQIAKYRPKLVLLADHLASCVRLK